ncbi:MAG: TonB-dependent receptor domain-containing protein [Parashewanella sp.]
MKFCRNLLYLSLLTTTIQSQVNAKDSNNVLGNPKVDAIEVIKITGKHHQRSIKLAPPGEAVITMEQIEEQQATQFAELVDELPGIAVDGGTRVGGERINIWGFGEQEDLKIFLDNAPLGFEQYRYGSFFVDPDIIKQVEVIKGAHDVRSGNGGFGGSMYVTTKSANDLLRKGEHFGVRVKAGYRDNNDEKRYSTSLYGQLSSNLSAIAHVTYRDANDISLGDNTKFRYSGYKQDSVLAKLDWDADDHQLSLSYTDYQDKGQKPWANRRGQLPKVSNYNIKKYGSYEKALLATTAFNTYTDRNYSLNYRYTPQSSWIDTQFVISNSDNSRHFRRPEFEGKKIFVSVGSFGHQAWLDYKRQFIDLNNTSYFGDNTLLFGLQHMALDRDSLVFNKSYIKSKGKNFGRFTPYFQPSGTQKNSAIYAEFSYAVNDTFSIQPSVRYDYVRSKGKGNLATDYNNPEAGHDYSGVSHRGLSTRLNALYQLTDATKLYFDYANTMRAPLVDEIYAVQYIRASKAISTSRDLKVERLQAYKLGMTNISHDLFSQNDSLSSQVTLFYHQVKNDIALRKGNQVKTKGDDRRFQQLQGNHTNLDGYNTIGADLVVNYRNNDFFADLTASYIHGKHQGSLYDSSGKDEHLTNLVPANIRLGLGYYLTEDIMMSWAGKWHDRKSEDEIPVKSPFNSDKPSDAYFIQDVFVKYQPKSGFLKNVESHLTIKNIADRYYTPYLGDGVPAAGRDIRISVAYKF